MHATTDNRGETVLKIPALPARRPDPKRKSRLHPLYGGVTGTKAPSAQRTMLAVEIETNNRYEKEVGRILGRHLSRHLSAVRTRRIGDHMENR